MGRFVESARGGFSGLDIIVLILQMGKCTLEGEAVPECGIARTWWIK